MTQASIEQHPDVDIDWQWNIVQSVNNFISNKPDVRMRFTAAGTYNHRQFNWISIFNNQCVQHKSGWKLHISVSLFNAKAVLEAVLPILCERNVNFKVAANMDFLAYLNYESLAGKQRGKFITVYSDSTDQAVKLADELHNATLQFSSPTISTDRQYRPNSIVYYRYGSFVAEFIQSLWGALLPVMYVDGKKCYDKKQLLNAGHELQDPFNPAVEQKQNDESILSDQYVTFLTLNTTDTVNTLLGMDIKNKRRCVIKKASKNSTTERSGYDAINRLKIESVILEKLKHSQCTPKYYDAFYDNDRHFCLVMQDISGENLQDTLLSYQSERKTIPNDKSCEWACDIAQVLAMLHKKSIIHGDIKLENIIVHDQGLTVIDFDSASDFENNYIIQACGSAGYTNRNRDQGGLPTVQDDLYAYGATLYYLFANINPHKMPLEVGQDDVDIIDLRDEVPRQIRSIIEGCLSGSFDSAEQVIAILNDDSARCQIQTPAIQSSYSDKLHFLIKHYLDKSYRPQKNEYKLNTTAIGDIEINDLRGIAGSLLALASVALTNKHDADYIKSIKTIANQLINQPCDYNKIAGLYVGESGKALALLYAANATKDDALAKRARQWLNTANLLPLHSIDLFNGAAGRLRVNIIFWLMTKQDSYLQYANQCVAYLLTNMRIEHDLVYWLNPTVESTDEDLVWNESDKLLGYAHGVAGIGDALLDYYSVTQDHDVLEILNKIVSTLLSKSVLQPDGKGALWPNDINGEPGSSYWCYGGAGISVFLARLIQLDLLDRASIDVEQWLLPVVESARGSAPILCHGLAGNLETLIDTHQYLPNINIDSAAEKLERILATWLKAYSNNAFKTANPQFHFYGYLDGLAGIISVYNRMLNPVVPNPLHIGFANYLMGGE